MLLYIQHLRTNSPHPACSTEHHLHHPLTFYHHPERLLVVANVPPAHLHYPNHSAVLFHRWIRLVRSRSHSKRNLAAFDEAKWSDLARVGAEEWMGHQERAAIGNSAVWHLVLVCWGEEVDDDNG